MASNHFPFPLLFIAGPSSRPPSPQKPKPFAGHHSEICAVCYSPDGNQIATGGRDPPIRIWDSHSGEMLIELWKPSYGVTSLFYSPDGNRLTSAGSDGGICVWDASDGALVLERADAHRQYTIIASSRDNQRIASCGGDQMLRIWRAEDITQIINIPDHPDVVLSVHFSPDGRQLVTSCADYKIRIFDVATGTLAIGPIEDCADDPEMDKLFETQAVIYSPDGKRLVSNSSHGRRIRIWDASTGAVLCVLKGHTCGVLCLAFSSNGKQILGGSFDHRICLWDSDTGECIGGPVRGHDSAIRAVSLAPDGAHFVTGAQDGSMRIWHTQTRKVILPQLTESEQERYSQGPFRGHIRRVNAVAYFPDGSRVASASDDGTIRIWNFETGMEMEPLLGLGHPVEWLSISLSSDGSRLASVARGGRVRVWDTRTGDAVLGPLGTSWVLCVEFSPDDRLIAGASDGRISLWDSQTGQQLRSMKGNSRTVFALSFSRDGSRLASVGEDKSVYVWDVSTAQIVTGPFEGHTSFVRSVAFSPDGLHIVSGSDDRTLRVWDAKTGATILGPLHTFSEVPCVLYSPDGTRISSASYDRTMRMWDAHTGNLLHGPLKGNDGVTCATYSPDGKHILTGSDDGPLKIWDSTNGLIIHASDSESHHVESSDLVLDLPATVVSGMAPSSQYVDATGVGDILDRAATRPQNDDMAMPETQSSSPSMFARIRQFTVDVFRRTQSASGRVRVTEVAAGRGQRRILAAGEPEDAEDVRRASARRWTWDVDDEENGISGYSGASERNTPCVDVVCFCLCIPCCRDHDNQTAS